MLPMAEPVAVPVGEPTAPPPLLTVLVPSGLRSGDTFAVQAPNGEFLSVQVPAGCLPGFPFSVIVPPHVLVAPATVFAPMAVPVHDPALQVDLLSRATHPTPKEMQRIGDAFRSQRLHLEGKEGTGSTARPPPLQADNCGCIANVQTKGQWELPPKMSTCGIISTVQLDLRDQQLQPGQRTFTIKSCACIHTNELIVPPEINVQGGGCALISNVQQNDNRPKEIRGTRVPPVAAVRTGGCACIHTTSATTIEHGQAIPKSCTIQ